MKRKSNPLLPAGLLLGMACLILDSSCGAKSAGQAIEICLQTVVPSLFPMFVLSGLVTQYLSLGNISEGLEKLISFPRGSSGLFLMGLAGGFPTGAQCIQQAVEKNGLSGKDGERMLGLCDHCGPAFLFGITARLFSSPWAAPALFLIQAECALIMAHFWPGTPGKAIRLPTAAITVTDSIRRAIQSMAFVCAWIVLANVICGFLNRWLFPFLPSFIPVLIRGILELTGGVLSLADVPSESLRFLLCCAMINWGGICVHLQIQSLAAGAGLSVRSCVLQKLCQAFLSVLLAAGYLTIGPAGLIFPLFLLIPGKKVWKNKRKPCIMASVREGTNHAVPKENASVLPVLSVQRKAQ